MRMRTPSAGHVSSLDHVSLPSRVVGQPAWQGSLRPSTPEALHVPEMEILVLIIKFHPKRTFGPLGLCLVSSSLLQCIMTPQREKKLLLDNGGSVSSEAIKRNVSHSFERVLLLILLDL